MTNHQEVPEPLKDPASALHCIILKYGRGIKAKKFLKYAFTRFCIDDRERNILKGVFEQATLVEYRTC